jgi:hypothetical protein
MQLQKYLNVWLVENANENRKLFSNNDLRVLFPGISNESFRTLLSRAVKDGCLSRVCRGVYLYEKVSQNGFELFYVAALLRADGFNYVSLETVLSELNIISQIPLNKIFVMSSGRSNVISCGKFGEIEFIHTNQKPSEIKDCLFYDEKCKMWKANAKQALRDMKETKRDCDLIDWEVVNEFV